MEIFSLEGGAADEAAVDVGLGEEFMGIVRLDAAAVEQRRLRGGFGVGLGEAGAQSRWSLPIASARRRSGSP